MGNQLALDLAALSKEMRLLLFLIKMESSDQELVGHLEMLRDIDWNHFNELAMHHRVYPIVYKKLKDLAYHNIPSFVVSTLQKAYQRSTFQMLQLSGEMEQICKVFTENGIQLLVLKGPVLSLDLYGDLSLRTSRDLDILIPIEELEQAEEILFQQQYIKVEEYSTILSDWKWRHHHITYFHPHRKVTIEIHWRLGPGPAKEPSFQELWERKRASSLTSFPVYFLGREDLFLFLVSHGSRHGWSRLRWLADIERITTQDLNWKRLLILLKKYQSLQNGGQALILTSQLLNTPIKEEMKTFIAGTRSFRLAKDALFYLRQMVNLHNPPLPLEVSRYHKRHLFSLLSTQKKILYILSLFFPFPEDAETLPLPHALHFLYFPLRPLLWAWRKTKKACLKLGEIT